MPTETETVATCGEAFPRSPAERARLVKQWTPLVCKIAARYAGRLSRWYEFSDLVSIGQMTLWESTRTHDPLGGAKFSTYAYHSVFRRYEALIDHWRQGIRRGSTRNVPFDETHQDGSPVRQFPDDERTAEEALGVREEVLALTRLISLPNTLKPAERTVICGRFMGDRLLDEIGRELGITRERVRQIEQRALQKLRKAMIETLPSRATARACASHKQVTPRAVSSRKVARPARVA